MNSFDLCFDLILLLEGEKYTNIPEDKGGPTKYGITQKVASKYGIEDVKYLTKEQAKDIYYQEYYKNFKLDRVNDIRKQALIFGTVVNTGYAGVKLLQQALNLMGYNLKVDAIIGFNTLHAINDCNFNLLMDKLEQQQSRYYKNIVARNPTQQKFLKGWIKRISKKNDYINNMKLL